MTAPTYTGLARAVDSIPVVPTSAARNARYTNPPTHFRVHNLETGSIERWTGTAWVPLGLYGSVTPFAYGGVGDGSTDDSAAINAALATGQDVDLIGRIWKANNLTQNTNDQCLFSSIGPAQIIKNANGVLFTATGARVLVARVHFRGDAASPVYTGHNVLATGDDFMMYACGSRWAYDRAVKATGSHVQIIGQTDIYQTADATASGYDIEIGVSGTVTLYHELFGVRSSQGTGGIKFIDCGSQKVTGGQIGKLTVGAGTRPSGVNGGIYQGVRIIGNAVVEISTSLFSGCQFAANLTFDAATSAHSVDLSNSFAATSVITNSGNINAPIMRSIGTGSPSAQQLRYGDDTSAAVLTIYPGSGAFDFSGDVTATGGYRQTVGPFTQENVAAAQTNVALVGTRFVAPRAGSVTGVVVKSTEARTADTLTIEVYKNTGLSGAAGSGTGLTAVLDGTNTSVKATTQAKDTDTFAAGDEVYAVITTGGGWTPTTADVRVWIEVET